jgi:hypothetical protein
MAMEDVAVLAAELARGLLDELPMRPSVDLHTPSRDAHIHKRRYSGKVPLRHHPGIETRQRVTRMKIYVREDCIATRNLSRCARATLTRWRSPSNSPACRGGHAPCWAVTSLSNVDVTFCSG